MKAYELENVQNLPVLYCRGFDYYILENPKDIGDGFYWACAALVEGQPERNDEGIFPGCIAVFERIKVPEEGDELVDCYKMICPYCFRRVTQNEIESAQPWD